MLFYKKDENKIKERSLVKTKYRGSVIIARVDTINDDHFITEGVMFEEPMVRHYNHGYCLPLKDVEKIYPELVSFEEAVKEFEKERNNEKNS